MNLYEPREVLSWCVNLKRNFTSQKKFHYQVDGEKNPLHYNANGGQFLAGLDIKKSKKCKLEKIDISRNFFWAVECLWKFQGKWEFLLKLTYLWFWVSLCFPKAAIPNLRNLFTLLCLAFKKDVEFYNEFLWGVCF